MYKQTYLNYLVKLNRIFKFLHLTNNTATYICTYKSIIVTALKFILSKNIYLLK